MNRPSILIIDDEPDNFDVIEILLGDRDYQLHYGASGEAAIASLSIYNPDLILLDVMMPGTDGIEVCRRIKAMPQWQAVPIIIVTALSGKSDLARCLSAGADDFISKPVNAVELRARVSSMLRIKHQYDEVQTLLQLRQDMVNAIVHDLRNPLANILLGLELVSCAKYPPEKQQRKLTQIYASARSLQVLIDDLLQMALLESGHLRLDRTSVNLCELVKSAISNFRAIATEQNQSLIVRLPEEAIPEIWVDATLMHRTLDNLLANAIKFSPPNTEIAVNVECPNTGENTRDCKIQVVDSGPGVSAALQHKIFEKYQIGTVMPEVSQIGLGLAFCKMVVEAHGGAIGVRNHQPHGAIFEISLTSSP